MTRHSKPMTDISSVNMKRLSTGLSRSTKNVETVPNWSAKPANGDLKAAMQERINQRTVVRLANSSYDQTR